MNVNDQTERDWHFREWMRAKGKRQASLVSELGWSKAKAHDVWHGHQRYNRDLVNEIADWLGVHDYFLFMTPRDAAALDALREVARTLVADIEKE